MDNKKIGIYLQGKRKESKMTQADLAEKLNVTYQAVSRWETGESIPDIQTLDHIATLYNISVDEILQRRLIEVEESDANDLTVQKVMFFLVPVIHSIGIAVLLLFRYFDLHTVGMLGFFITIVLGLFVHVISYATIEKKENINAKWFFATFVWLIISLMLVAIINNVN